MAPHLSVTSSPNRATTAHSSLVSTTSPHNDEAATPTDLLLATPPAVVKLLALSAPVIHGLTVLVQLLTWSHPSFFASLLVLLSWWALCLFGTYIAQYGLNALLLCSISLHYLTSASTRAHHRRLARAPTLTPAGYATLISETQTLTTHLHALRVSLIQPLASQLSLTPLVAGRPSPAYTSARFLVTSYPFYLALTSLIHFRLILLAIGSTAILWNAPFFRTLRSLLKKSALVRWLGRILLAVLNGGAGLGAELKSTKSGLGVPGLLSRHSVPASGAEERAVKKEDTGLSQGEGEEVQVLFTCMENQRWWVGLDWTHALLPGERASWTDPALHPSSPPASFTLPPPSVSYIPAPTKADPNARLKRSTEWRWIDPEWKVMLSTAPSSPSTPALGSSSTPLGSPSLPTASQIPVAEDAANPLPLPSHPPSEDFFSNWQVDDEGWQYGDNMFEKMGPKGGLGKYTRRRAWVRRAGLVGKEEIVPGGKESDKEMEKDKEREKEKEKEKEEEKEKEREQEMEKEKDKNAGSGLGSPKLSTTLRSPSRDSMVKEKRRSDVSPSPLGGGEIRRRKSSGSSKPPSAGQVAPVAKQATEGSKGT